MITFYLGTAVMLVLLVLLMMVVTVVDSAVWLRHIILFGLVDRNSDTIRSEVSPFFQKRVQEDEPQ